MPADLTRVALATALAAALLTACTPGGEPPPAGAPAAPPPASAGPSTEPTTAPPGPGFRLEPFHPAAYDAWRVRIPRGFPISHDLHPHGSEFGPRVRPVRGEFCDAEGFGGHAEVDVLRDGVVGPEYADARELRLFPDDSAAHRFLVVAARTAASCPREVRDGGTRVHDVRPLRAGEEAVRIVRTYRAADDLPILGATWWDVVRVGNAVLVTSTSGEYAAGETLGLGLREHEQRVRRVVDRMCVFSATGCGATAPLLVLRHDGVGPFRLGVGRGVLVDLGAEVAPMRNGTGCWSFAAVVQGERIGGAVDPGLGLAVLSGRALRTPEGIAAGSRLADVRRTFARLTGDPGSLLFATVGDRATYRFEMFGGRVSNLMLLHPGQGCGG